MKNAKILIADDEPLNLILFSQMLKSSDYIVSSAKDGSEAVELALKEKPDIIILDWNMPRLNGLEALIKLKKEKETRDIPVVMITGVMTSPENLKQAYDEGAVDFLRKPFDRVELLARVKSILLLSSSLIELNEKYKTIEQNHKFVNSLINTVPHSIVFYKIGGEVIDCNHQFKLLLGLQNVQSGTNVYTLCNNEIAELHRTNDDELLKTNAQNVSYEGTVGPDRHRFIFSKSLYKNYKGEPEGFICLMTDVEDLKKAHEEIVETKKRELASSALRLVHLSEMNNSLITYLDKINEYTSKEGRKIINEVIKHFNINSGENVWSEFETRFENVYESFYQKLDELFPKLTHKERKLCAFLRLNLTSKDIAAITFQNPQSVDMARYRLRKKLDLSSEENLIDFLMKIDE